MTTLLSFVPVLLALSALVVVFLLPSAATVSVSHEKADES